MKITYTNQEVRLRQTLFDRVLQELARVIEPYGLCMDSDPSGSGYHTYIRDRFTLVATVTWWENANQGREAEWTVRRGESIPATQYANSRPAFNGTFLPWESSKAQCLIDAVEQVLHETYPPAERLVRGIDKESENDS